MSERFRSTCALTHTGAWHEDEDGAAYWTCCGNQARTATWCQPTGQSSPLAGPQEARAEEGQSEGEWLLVGHPEANAKGEGPPSDFLMEQAAKKFTYAQLVAGLKAGRFRNILVMSGPGVSESSGIPDFRSPEPGVLASLKDFDMPSPAALFRHDYFLEKPEVLYRFAQNYDLDLSDCEPSPSHYFIKLLADRGLLLANVTQNIDNLEEKTGIDMGRVVQASGVSTGAACAKC